MSRKIWSAKKWKTVAPGVPAIHNPDYARRENFVLVNITNKSRRYLELAKNNAFHSDFCHKHGSVLVRGGAVINTSFNKVIYNSFADRFRYGQEGYGTRHAEIGVVLGLSRAMTQDADIYVVRVNNMGDYRLSYPCPMCKNTAEFCGIRRIIYSVDNERIGIVKL